MYLFFLIFFLYTFSSKLFHRPTSTPLWPPVVPQTPDWKPLSLLILLIFHLMLLPVSFILNVRSVKRHMLSTGPPNIARAALKYFWSAIFESRKWRKNSQCIESKRTFKNIECWNVFVESKQTCKNILKDLFKTICLLAKHHYLNIVLLKGQFNTKSTANLKRCIGEKFKFQRSFLQCISKRASKWDSLLAH